MAVHNGLFWVSWIAGENADLGGAAGELDVDVVEVFVWNDGRDLDEGCFGYADLVVIVDAPAPWPSGSVDGKVDP